MTFRELFVLYEKVARIGDCCLKGNWRQPGVWKLVIAYASSFPRCVRGRKASEGLGQVDTLPCMGVEKWNNNHVMQQSHVLVVDYKRA